MEAIDAEKQNIISVFCSRCTPPHKIGEITENGLVVRHKGRNISVMSLSEDNHSNVLLAIGCDRCGTVKKMYLSEIIRIGSGKQTLDRADKK